jgi:hypothetical protein
LVKDDLKERLERQAAWQRGRCAASWAEKLRTAVIMRRAALALRQAPTVSTEGARRPRE